MSEHLGGEKRASDRSNDGMDCVPDGINPRNFIGEKFEQEKNTRNTNDKIITKWRNPNELANRVLPFGLCHSFDIRHSTFVISYCAVLDIRIVREQPDFVKTRLALRGGGDETKIDELLRVDAERRKAETALQALNAERKKLSKEIGGMRSRGQDSPEL